MTTEAFNPPTPITIATAGPHAIPFPYNTGAVRAGVENLTNGQITDLILGTDFTVTPANSESGGDLTLTGPAFVSHSGKKLHIGRQTPEVQGWVGTQGHREKGMERQLDRTVRRLQELSRIIVGAVGAAVPLKRFTPMPGRLIIFDAQGQPMNGPDATDIAQAQTNAAIAQAAADAASDAEANAMAWAGTVNSTFLQTSSRRCTLGGTANAITLTTGGSVVSVTTGQRFRALATAANTGAATLQIDALAPVAILTLAGGAVPANHWLAGQELELTYDGAAWRVEPDGLYNRVCAILEDQKPSGTQGGTFNAGSDRTRTLTTLVENKGGLVNLAGNQFTLQAGKYRIDALSVAGSVTSHRLSIYNVTDALKVAAGMAVMANHAPVNIVEIFYNSEASVESGVEILSAKAFEIRHRCTSSHSGGGFGEAFGIVGEPEIYTRVKITALKS